MTLGPIGNVRAETSGQSILGAGGHSKN